MLRSESYFETQKIKNLYMFNVYMFPIALKIDISVWYCVSFVLDTTPNKCWQCRNGELPKSGTASVCWTVTWFTNSLKTVWDTRIVTPATIHSWLLSVSVWIWFGRIWDFDDVGERTLVDECAVNVSSYTHWIHFETRSLISSDVLVHSWNARCSRILQT